MTHSFLEALNPSTEDCERHAKMESLLIILRSSISVHNATVFKLRNKITTSSLTNKSPAIQPGEGQQN